VAWPITDDGCAVTPRSNFSQYWTELGGWCAPLVRSVRSSSAFLQLDGYIRFAW